MPTCRKCNQDHFNFAACPAPPVPVKVADRIYRTTPDGYHESTGWGASARARVISRFPPRQRTGSLTGPDGEPYQPDFPDAA